MSQTHSWRTILPLLNVPTDAWLAPTKQCSNSSTLAAVVLFASTSQGLRQDSAPNMLYGHRYSSITSKHLRSSLNQTPESEMEIEESLVRYVSAFRLEELRHCMAKLSGMRVRRIT
ncbi:hypothetical protein BJX66DRAFT_286936 [Aspergillus keveii]|uniref:Uncharacterized protein n=1 Tax=Aspergillus keveii TaxID=714993 RepID=A0ABR4FVR8_9EURO